MLSNNGLMSMQHVQDVLLVLVLAINSDQFQIYRVALYYSSRPFLCTLGTIINDGKDCRRR